MGNHINIVVHTGDSQSKREIQCEASLEPGWYSVLCTTILPYEESPFEVELVCNYPVNFVEIDDSLKTKGEKLAEGLVKAKEGAKKASEKLNAKLKKSTKLDVGSMVKKGASTVSGTKDMDFVD